MKPQKLHSQNTLAKLFGHDRRTIAVVLKGVRPGGKVGKFPGWSRAVFLAAQKARKEAKSVPKKLRDALLHERIRALELRNAVADGTLIPLREANADLSNCLRRISDHIHRKLVDELPSECAGLDVGQIQIKARKLKAECMAMFEQLRKKWAK